MTGQGESNVNIDNTLEPEEAAAPGGPSEPPRSTWGRIKLIIQVVEIRLRFIVILVGTGLVIGYWDTLLNYWDKWTRPKNAAAVQVQADREFYCPMHPWVTRASRDPDGTVPKCPICGMAMSTRKKGEQPELPANVTGRVQFSPERIRLGGLQTQEVGYRSLVKQIVTVGSLQYDESRLSRIVSRVAGYVEKLYIDKTFEQVSMGQPMVELYSPELSTAARELLIASRSNLQLDLQQLTRTKLQLMGVAPSEIDEILRTGKATHRLLIRSPQAGFVIEKTIVKGSRVEMGQTLFDVADISQVWIQADVYEKDVAFLKQGQKVTATVEALPGQVFPGKVQLVHPMMDAATRTNAVRFSVNNEGKALRPGMYATVHIDVPLVELEPYSSMASTGPATTTTGLSEYYVCPVHSDVVEAASGHCPIGQEKLERRTLPANRGLIWACPMHPEVTALRSGSSCPKCGMKLLPVFLETAPRGQTLAVPELAVVDTGVKQVVYVQREAGVFEGVLVELGTRVGEFYPVLKGVQAGDRIVARGAFLVDAETRLNPAAGAAFSGATAGPKGSKTADAKISGATGSGESHD